MNLTAADLDNMERAASAATSGPWRVSRAARYVGPFGRPVAELIPRDGARADAEHIAAFSPEIALALVALARAGLDQRVLA